MAELRDRIDITVEELEESLGAVRLPRFIAESEKSFVGRIDSICDEICSDTNKRAIFVFCRLNNKERNMMLFP